ncbi:hypothetical protein U1Q18_028016, partial [Sarracenia purpurea var. burkii]
MAKQHKVHRQGLKLEHAKLEAEALMETSRKSVEGCRKLVMERNSIVAVLKSKDNSLE